jgi:predicted RNA-binding Zn ribbon-like protein
LALDFVNTVDWGEGELVHERLVDFAALTRWAAGAGVLQAQPAGALRRWASAHATAAAAVHREALRLRDTLQRLFAGMVHARPGAPPPEAPFQELRLAVDEALSRRTLMRTSPKATGTSAAWAWRGWGEEPGCLRWAMAWSAAELLASPEVERLRKCAGPVCGWLYLDHSRNGLRRWCEMRTCGAQDKARRYYARTHAR